MINSYIEDLYTFNKKRSFNESYVPLNFNNFTLNEWFEIARKKMPDSIISDELLKDIFYKNNMYRGYNGSKSNFNFLHAIPGDHIRYNAYSSTGGIYSKWIDGHEDWKNYPKRTKSIVCTTEKNFAEEYGDGIIYQVYPIELDKKIGICSEQDMWYSFKIGERKVFDENITPYENINDLFDEIFDYPTDNELKMYFKKTYSYSDFILLLNALDTKEIGISNINKFLKSKKYPFKVYTVPLTIISEQSKFISFIDFFTKLLNPVINKFNLITVEEYYTKELYKYNTIMEKREVWTDSECLMIKL